MPFSEHQAYLSHSTATIGVSKDSIGKQSTSLQTSAWFACCAHVLVENAHGEPKLSLGETAIAAVWEVGGGYYTFHYLEKANV